MSDNQDFHHWFAGVQGCPILDVRSPGEYARGHLPGALSHPLFDDEERAMIGTTYKKKGKRSAIKQGLKLIGPKMAHLLADVESLGSEEIAMYCWRGGMRSDSFAWLLRTAGFNVKVLNGGYKSYRNVLHNYFERPLDLRVISGFTGSRKTDFLAMLQKEGAQVVDLEMLAQHQGSSFGNQKSVGQPTTEHFQNLVFSAFSELDHAAPIWIEDECMRIGNVTTIEALHVQKEKSRHYFLEIPKVERINFLVQDYGQLEREKLIAATLGIRKRLGGLQTKLAINYINQGKLAEAVDIILEYYDKQYANALARKRKYIYRHHQVSMDDLPTLARKIVKERVHAV